MPDKHPKKSASGHAAGRGRSEQHFAFCPYLHLQLDEEHPGVRRCVALSQLESLATELSRRQRHQTNACPSLVDSLNKRNSRASTRDIQIRSLQSLTLMEMVQDVMLFGILSQSKRRIHDFSFFLFFSICFIKKDMPP